MTVTSELAWLHALSDSPGIAQRPLLRRDGVLAPVVEADANGRVLGLWTVMEWVEGPPLGRLPTAEEARAVGGLIAELHDRSEAWTRAIDFGRCGVGPFALDVAMVQHSLTSELGEHLRAGYLHRRPDAVLERSALRDLRFLAALENLVTLSAFSDEFEFIRTALPDLVKSAEGQQ